MIVVGVLMAVAALALFLYAERRAPTLENALTREEVLTDGAYLFARLAAAVVGLGGLAMATVGIVLSSRR